MNPFFISGFPGKKYFCNRKTELSKLEEAFYNSRNVTLFSLRRMGKSWLVKYHFQNLGSEVDCIYADIFPAMNLPAMSEIIADSVTKQLGKNTKDYILTITSFIKSINATLSFDEVSGKPEIKFGVGKSERDEINLEKIFDFLNKKKKKTLLAIDEFQQVRNFPDANAEAYLRSLVQKYKNIKFIFLGSNRGILESMFSDPGKPFYRSTQFMYLKEIDEKKYVNFIVKNFTAGKIKITHEQAETITRLCRGHTYYVQYLCNRIYSKNKNCTDRLIYETFDEILKENEPVYYNYKNLLTDIQWKLAVAIAKEDKVYEPFSISFIKDYNLPSASTVKRSLDALLTKEMVMYHEDHYWVYDVFFSQWLKQNTP